MTTAKAKQLASDLMDAGVKVTLTPRGADDWEVYAEPTGGPVEITQVAPLASKYSVSSPVTSARFV